ncbi:MAG: thiamine diphosphokinase [Symbiobacteriaceae bacterium]|nr:thiamine diphosphokinase [Symbiobacteriaceae bacterium]
MSKIAYLFLAGECPDPWHEDLSDTDALLVAVDGGYVHLRRLGLKADILMGDFDSITAEHYADLARMGTEVIRWPREKDNSDSDLACGELYRRGYSLLYLFGALGGTRFDHALGNIGMMHLWKRRGLRIVLLQGNLHAEVLSQESVLLRGNSGDLISLLPLTPEVTSVSTNGLKFTLNQESLYAGESRSLSNCFITERICLEVGEGSLLLMHYRTGR